jgi:predicted alpha/beta-fold hydrolase
MRTGIPFVLNDVEDQEYVRVWARNAYDGEHLALDVAFPYSSSSSADHRGSGSDDDDDAGETSSYENDEEGGRRRRRRSIDGDDACGAQIMTFVHDIAKPVYLLLHGLNGGSHEQYM